MRTIIAFVMVATSCFPQGPAAVTNEEARKAGEAWLSLVDGQKYEESWKTAGTQFRSQVTQDQWVAALQRGRDPFGPAVSRTVSRLDMAKTLRGAPDGDYAIYHFMTEFRNKSGVTE